MNLDIINQINESVAQESKDIKAEELKDKEKVLEKNTQTSQKIEQERAILTAEMSNKGSYGLNKSGGENESFFNKSSGSGSSLDDLFGSTSSTEKKTTSSSGYGYNYGYNQTTKKEETKQEKAREFANSFAKRAAKKAYKEWQTEEEQEKNSWNIFELKEQAEEERKQSRALTKEDKKKLRGSDIFKKSLLKGLASAGKGIIEHLYSIEK